MNSKDRLWSLGAGIVAVAVGAGTWFGVVAPELSAASSARDDLANVEDLNAVHQLRIAALEQDMARIEDLRAERDALSLGIPGSAQYSDFLRDIDAMAAASAVVITRVESQDPVAYEPPVVESPTEAQPEVDATEGAATEEQPSSAAGSAAAVGGEGAPAATPDEGGATGSALVPLTDARIGPHNFAAIPVTIDVAGDVSAIEDFLSRLQAGERIMTVTTASIKAPDGASQSVPTVEGAAPVTGSGQVVGFLYVLQSGGPAVP